MRRCLVIANQALGGERLHDEVLQRVRQGPCRFHVVVPVACSVSGDACADSDPVTIAQRRLDVTLSMLHGLGVLATGDVVDGDEVTTVESLLTREHFDDVVFERAVAV